MEKRHVVDGLRLEERADKTPCIIGYAARFNVLSDPIMGMFVERIAPGAFRRYLESGGEVVALWDHDSSKPLGRRSVGTLRLSEDSSGLRYELDPPDTSWGRDAVASIRRGDVKGSSFGFHTIKDAWMDRDSDCPTRELQDVDVFDVSPTAFPAYPDTSAALRSLETFREKKYNVKRKFLLWICESYN